MPIRKSKGLTAPESQRETLGAVSWLIVASSIGLVLQYFLLFQPDTSPANAMMDIIYDAPSFVGNLATKLDLRPGEEQLPQMNSSSGTTTDIASGNSDTEFPVESREEDDEDEPLVNLPKTIPLQVVDNFNPNKFDYQQPALRTDYNLPPPVPTNQSAVFIVLSARYNFEERAAIRETWAQGNDNVYFVVGGPVPSDRRDMDRSNPLSTSSLLFQEQEHFQDIIDVIHPDTYKSLPYKLHFSVRWIMKHCQHVNWIVKSDDDIFVRVKSLQYYVLRHMNHNHPLVLGSIVTDHKPHRKGKWAESPKFRDKVYPPWPFGSAGYVLSRPVAQYIADTDDLYYFQGEDAGLGIWLSQSPLQVTFVDSPELQKDEYCQEKHFIIGHDIGVDKMRTCWSKVGDTVPQIPHIVAFSASRKDMYPNIIKNEHK